MIEIKNTSFSYKTFSKKQGLAGSLFDFVKRDSSQIEAVKDINLSINDGEMIGLIGPNGAGKTTLIKMLTGILTPSDGKITIDSFVPDNRENLFLKNIGVLFGQKSQLSWDLPAIDTLNMLSKIYNLTEKNYKKRLGDLSGILKTTDILNQPVRKLSLGQRVRCEFMCALIHSPKYLFLDEPTLGLDIMTQDAIYDLLNLENQQHQTTVIITSHYLRDIDNLSNRLIILAKGRIIFDGDTQRLPVNLDQNQNFIVKAIQPDQPIFIGQNESALDMNANGEMLIPVDMLTQKNTRINYANLSYIKRQDMSLESFVIDLYKKTN
ncbi:ABC transporter ATP-binding protein [Oenococcus oeni]|uniref:ABC transporter ATP-binding protein n=1 Tax=Oenococcus oeni TaxID=1247 RepID=UPI0010B0405D|nr:ATP-binding cassette domain-containing protein [Oenococcus oeni]SYW14950.1 conserved hypothetical protein [Oenococcus oeni]